MSLQRENSRVKRPAPVAGIDGMLVNVASAQAVLQKAAIEYTMREDSARHALGEQVIRESGPIR